MNAALALKANISDVSRTVAEVATSLDDKVGIEELSWLLDEKISKDELQYLLTNKVSIEEVRTLLDGKANLQEVGEDLQHMSLKIDDKYNELKDKLNWMA